MTQRYILHNGIPTPEPDLYKWAAWFEVTENRILKQDRKGKILVSTVFLALDHNFSKVGDPILWETMIFKGDHDGEMERYMTKEEALLGHEKWKELCFSPGT